MTKYYQEENIEKNLPRAQTTVYTVVRTFCVLERRYHHLRLYKIQYI
jgi:hypothetical protein